MRASQKIVWSEGLLMAPQHLQQQDRYHEGQLCDRLDALTPFNWGVLRVEVDKKALSAGQVQLTVFEGVLPDGVVLSLRSGHPELPGTRGIAEHFPHAATCLDVYLGLPEEREGIDNFTEDAGAQVRYAASQRSMHDLAGSGSSAEVPFARRRPLLLFGDEPREGIVCFKLLEIVRDDSGSLVISDPYIPPSLRVDASLFLIAGLRRLLGTMLTRQKALSEARRQATHATVEFNAKDVTRYLLLSVINEYIPVLKHIIDSGHMSPCDCYTTLLRLGGQLTTFSTEISPTDLPRFEYTNLRATFEELFARLTALLQATIEDNFVALTLQPRHDGMYMGASDDERVWSCHQYVLAIKTELPEQPTATQVPRLSKLASWNEINGILTMATPGAAVEVTYRPPPEVPVKAGLVYFNVTIDNAYWRSIKHDKNIALYLPPLFDPKTTTVQLMGVLPRHHAKVA
jgi:type VI secretion system protein ImpJ